MDNKKFKCAWISNIPWYFTYHRCVICSKKESSETLTGMFHATVAKWAHCFTRLWRFTWSQKRRYKLYDNWWNNASLVSTSSNTSNDRSSQNYVWLFHLYLFKIFSRIVKCMVAETIKIMKDKADNSRGRKKDELTQAYKSYADYAFPNYETCHPCCKNAADSFLCTQTNDECQFPNWKYVLRKCTDCTSIAIPGVERDSHRGWGRFPSSKMTTVSWTFRCRKWTHIAVLVVARPGHPSNRQLHGPPLAGKSMRYVHISSPVAEAIQIHISSAACPYCIFMCPAIDLSVISSLQSLNFTLPFYRSR